MVQLTVRPSAVYNAGTSWILVGSWSASYSSLNETAPAEIYTWNSFSKSLFLLPTLHLHHAPRRRDAARVCTCTDAEVCNQTAGVHTSAGAAPIQIIPLPAAAPDVAAAADAATGGPRTSGCRAHHLSLLQLRARSP